MRSFDDNWSGASERELVWAADMIMTGLVLREYPATALGGLYAFKIQYLQEAQIIAVAK